MKSIYDEKRYVQIESVQSTIFFKSDKKLVKKLSLIAERIRVVGQVITRTCMINDHDGGGGEKTNASCLRSRNDINRRVSKRTRETTVVLDSVFVRRKCSNNCVLLAE